MGCDDGRDDERPAHRVWVDAFEIGVCQVTNAEYARFLDVTDHPPPPWWKDPSFNGPAQPVVGVSWFDAVRYCDWLGVRLPTEAEWECAAHGVLPVNDPALWQNGPEPVRRGEANAFGLYDMCTNVHEWCSDWYSNDYYSRSPELNPRGPESGSRRVSRGGSWRHKVKVSRCAARSSIPPRFQYADYGFRVAR